MIKALDVSEPSVVSLEMLAAPCSCQGCDRNSFIGMSELALLILHL